MLIHKIQTKNVYYKSHRKLQKLKLILKKSRIFYNILQAMNVIKDFFE